jgi:phosphomevalonate kinase
MNLSAHGKVFLAGEYAALDGAPALVVGIDRDLHARSEPAERMQIVRSGLLWDGGPAPEELRFAARAARICGEPKVRLVYEDELPKGLGSSAAATVIAVRALRPEEEVLPLAVAAHWAEQGGSGSGADVAASARGGVIEVRSRIPWRSVEELMSLSPQQIAAAQPLEVRRVRIPPDLRILLADTGHRADTRKLVREVRAFAAGDARRWLALFNSLSSYSQMLRAALEEAAGDPSAPPRQRALDFVRGAAAAMALLGEQARAPIITDELVRICALAASAGAAGKPSGAGGGDCAVILAFGDEARDRTEAVLKPHFSVLRVSPA